jgi:serine/threonine-protein kinase HipA
MTGRRLDVRIGANPVRVGELFTENSGNRETSTFVYDPDWISHPRGFAISPGLPLSAAPYYASNRNKGSSLPLPIADSAPDSWGRKVMKLLAGHDHLTDLDYLVGTDDALRMGALRYFDGTHEDAQALAPSPTDKEISQGAVGIPRLHDLDAVIHEARAFEADPAGYAARRAEMVGGDILREAVGSLGGARPKVNARDRDGALWIVKLPKQADDYAVARAEVLALTLAREVGINACDARIMNDAQSFPIALVRRFDRTGPDHAARVPFISALTFLGLEGEDALGTYEDIAMQMRAHAHNARDQMSELYRRMMFGILIRNTDDHLRNHGFLRGAAGWQLSPAYDINPEHRSGRGMQTPISAIHGNDASVRAALDAAEFFDVRPAGARHLARDMAQHIAKRWRPLGAELGMTARDTSAVAAAIETPQLEYAKTLAL